MLLMGYISRVGFRVKKPILDTFNEIYIVFIPSCGFFMFFKTGLFLLIFSIQNISSLA